MTNTLDAQIETPITACITQLENLLGAIHKERAALILNDLPALDLAIQSKETVLPAIDTAWRELLNIFQITLPTQTKVTEILESRGMFIQENIKQLWQKLIDMTQECQKQNQINEIVLRRNINRVNLLLSLFSGGGVYQTAYDAAGNSIKNSVSTLFAQV